MEPQHNKPTADELSVIRKTLFLQDPHHQQLIQAMLETLENQNATKGPEDDKEWFFVIRAAGLPDTTPEKDIYLINFSIGSGLEWELRSRIKTGLEGTQIPAIKISTWVVSLVKEFAKNRECEKIRALGAILFHRLDWEAAIDCHPKGLNSREL